MANTEPTACLFNASGSRCKAPKRTNLSMVMCQKHLKDFYGLEMGYHQDDHPTNVAWVGPFLRPVKNAAYFKRYTVIFPTKEFFDRTQRPEEFRDKDSSYRRYQMNPFILDYIRQYGMTLNKRVEHRLPIEIYRNLNSLDKDVDPGPNHETLFPTLISLVRSKKSISESHVRDQAIFKCLKDVSIYTKAGVKTLHDTDLSICMQYILFNCQFSEMRVTFDNDIFTDYLPYNCEFVDGIGLVATELINHPHPLIVNGVGSGSQIFYNAFVSMVQKEVLHKNYSLKDIPSQFALTNALKSGSTC